jgi:RNA polymerase sigma factor (sigma-70 family)
MLPRLVTPSTSYPELPAERVALALTGDREAFAELYSTYDPSVRAAVVAAIRHRPELEDELEDLVGEIWMRWLDRACWRLRKYDPTRGAFGFYLRMKAFATARALADLRIHRTAIVPLDDPLVWLFATEDPEARTLDRNELERLWAAMRERLNAIDLALFQGVLVEARLVREVGAELGLTDEVAYRRSHRLKQKLARIAAEVLGTRDGGSSRALVVLLACMLAQSMSGGMTRDGDRAPAIMGGSWIH